MVNLRVHFFFSTSFLSLSLEAVIIFPSLCNTRTRWFINTDTRVFAYNAVSFFFFFFVRQQPFSGPFENSFQKKKKNVFFSSLPLPLPSLSVSP